MPFVVPEFLPPHPRIEWRVCVQTAGGQPLFCHAWTVWNGSFLVVEGDGPASSALGSTATDTGASVSFAAGATTRPLVVDYTAAGHVLSDESVSSDGTAVISVTRESVDDGSRWWMPGMLARVTLGMGIGLIVDLLCQSFCWTVGGFVRAASNVGD